jgi:16S rRNA (guanine(966)-N(2))-methyltransferase RsmD
MRVIAGRAGGVPLKAPRGRGVRPTADRVREALFSVLGGRVTGAAVLDLFAGSGAVGIEALSRGAESCIFVENNGAHLAVIKANLVKTGLADKARLLRLEVRQALSLLCRERFQADFVFLDPPYSSDDIPAVLETVGRGALLKAGGLVVVEHSSRNRFWAEAYPDAKQKKYGDTFLTFIAHGSLASPV